MTTKHLPATAESEFPLLAHKIKNALSCRSSFSLIPNNLTFNGELYAYIHCNEVHLVSESINADSTKSLKGKVQLDGTANVSAVKWVRLESGYMLVIITETGVVYVYDKDGEGQIHSLKLEDNHLTGEVPVFAVDSDLDKRLYIGLQTGAVLTFQIDAHNFVKLASKSEHQSPHRDPITTLAVSGKSQCLIACGDSKGAISTCNEATTAGYQLIFEGAGFACTSLRFLNRFLVASFACGRVRVFDWNTKQLVAEVAAHSRSITGMDVAVAEEMVSRKEVVLVDAHGKSRSHA
jgi:WD40 repeat protein